MIQCQSCGRMHPDNVWCTCPAAEAAYRREQEHRRAIMAKAPENQPIREERSDD